MATPIIITGALGRMGKTLVELTINDPACELVGLMERQEHVQKLVADSLPTGTNLANLQVQAKNPVIIDFTSPEASLNLAKEVAEHGASLVIGTTGFTDEQKKDLAELATKAPIFWAPNMSIGVNVLLQVLPELVKKLGDAYDVEMVELHHNRKKDSPSGTALRLAECLAEAKEWELNDVACYHREGIIGARKKEEIGIQTIRGGDVVGVHTMYFMGPGERIEVTHQSHSRETFAQGALRAAKWLSGQKAGRLYGMQDIF